MMLFAGTVSAQTIFVSTKGNDHWYQSSACSYY